MITEIKNSQLDNEKLSHIFIPKGPSIDNFDFSKVVVKKPWGYEYLLYDDGQASAWVLYLKKDSLTSMHCHVYKKTALIVLAGEVACTTLHDGFLLKKGDGLILDKKVFHSTQCISSESAMLLEVEIPSRKADVVRLVDLYGRTSSGYESPDDTTYESRRQECISFLPYEINKEKKVGEMYFELALLPEEMILGPNKNEELLIILQGEIRDEKDKLLFTPGDIIIRHAQSMLKVKKESKILRISKEQDTTIRAVLFDFDGVLADTMEDNYQAWKKACAEHEIDLKKEDYFPFEGISVLVIAKQIIDKYKINGVSPNELFEKKENYYSLNNSFAFYPGVIEFVDYLKKKNFKLAIVSASHKKRLASTVSAEFLEKFDAVITGDNLERGKPYPEPYLEAMKKLQIAPYECIVVENAPAGIESAQRAHAFCIAVASTMDKSFLKAAPVIIEKFDELKNVYSIKKLLKNG